MGAKCFICSLIIFFGCGIGIASDTIIDESNLHALSNEATQLLADIIRHTPENETQLLVASSALSQCILIVHNAVARQKQKINSADSYTELLDASRPLLLVLDTVDRMSYAVAGHTVEQLKHNAVLSEPHSLSQKTIKIYFDFKEECKRLKKALPPNYVPM